MVSFEYYRKFEEECMGYHKRFTKMHLKEELTGLYLIRFFMRRNGNANTILI